VCALSSAHTGEHFAIPGEEQMTETTEKQRALAVMLGVEVDEVSEASYDDKVFEYGREEYLVCTDSEADEVWDERLESYIDECILPEVPEQFRNYFDHDAWKSDARHDGRGHAISSYDGEERDATDPETGETFVVFRLN
jgi:hypothetical protein